MLSRFVLLSIVVAGSAQAQPDAPAAEATPPARVVSPAPAPALPTVASPVLDPAAEAAQVVPEAAPAVVVAPVSREIAAEPVVSAARITPAPPADDRLFPRYEALKPAVAFWTRVFGQYSQHQSAVHSSIYPNKVFQVLDFRDRVATTDEVALRRYQSAQEEKAKKNVDQLLAQVHELRYSPDKLSEDQRTLWRLFADVPGDDRFKNAIGTFRAQRGLKERTAAALATSGKYLPEMESIFGSYRLPLRLTRLPLVESSFNVEAYSKVGAAGLWQFIPASARIYMRLNELVDDRRDPWTSTDAAARHLRDDYNALGAWPLALTAYNHGRGGVARGLKQTGGSTLPDLIAGYDSPSFGFASRNFYAEFLAASDVDRDWRRHFGEIQRNEAVRFDTVETKNYVPYETLRRLCNADDEVFRRLNPAYRPEVIEGKLYVPPGHLIRVPAGRASAFNVAYAKLGSSERFDAQRMFYLQHKVARGDSLGKVARKYGVTQASIKAANGLRDKSKLKVGQVIKVPPRQETRPGPVLVAVGESKPTLTRAQTDAVVAERVADELSSSKPGKKKSNARLHKVKSGQTLGGIARQYNVSVSALRTENGLSKGSHIKVGQKLRIPSS